MRRRTVLAAAGSLGTSLLAGCVGSSRDDPADGDSNRPSTTRSTARSTTPPGDGHRVVSLAASDDVPPAVPVDLTATVETAGITDDHTAQVRVAFRNAGDEPRRFGFGVHAPFTGGRSVDESWLLFPDMTVDGLPGHCWEPNRGLAYPLKLEFRLLDPGETVARTYELWGSDEDDACLPTGRFRFEEEYDVYKGAVEGFDWGFEVTVADA